MFIQLWKQALFCTENTVQLVFTNASLNKLEILNFSHQCEVIISEFLKNLPQIF